MTHIKLVLQLTVMVQRMVKQFIVHSHLLGHYASCACSSLLTTCKTQLILACMCITVFLTWNFYFSIA